MLRKMTMLRGLLLAGAAAVPGSAVVATGVIVATTGIAMSGNAVASSTVSAPASTPPDVDSDFQIDMLLGLVPDDEMESYLADQAEASELRIQACMAEAGFEYNIDLQAMGIEDPRGDTPALEWAQQYGFEVWTTMDPERNPYQMLDEVEWANQEIVDALSEDERNAWFEANSVCSTASHDEDDVYGNPMVQQALDEWLQTVSADPRVLDAEQAWRDCMAEAGQTFESQDAMYAEVFALWNGDEALFTKWQAFQDSSAWEEDSPDHAEWQALVDREIAIAVADAGCSPALEEARDEVKRDLRPAFVAVWETIDLDLPPVTSTDGDGQEG